jgi:hypothetical protein
MAHRENEADIVMMNHYHGEPPDPFVSGQHMIISIVMLRHPIKTVPSIILYKCYHNRSVKPFVSVTLHHCILALISMRNSKESTIPPTVFVATGNLVDKIINQRNTFKYNGSPNRNTSEAAFLDGTTSSSSFKRTHNALTHHHIKELIASWIIGYNLINEILNPVDKIRKQWIHQKSWNHMTLLPFYSGNTNNLLKPLEEWGENVKIIVGYTKFNISTTTHRFPINISAFKRSILADAFQLFDQCIPTNIDPDMTILDDMIVTQFQGRILVCHKNFNNSTTTDSFQSLTPNIGVGNIYLSRCSPSN